MRTRDVPLLPIRDRLARIRKSSVQGRREAAKELEGSSDPSAGLILLYMLEDVSPDVRDQALRSLVSRGGLLARIGARACLQDSVSYVRNSAAEALGVFGDVRAGYGLQQALETGDMVLRCSAATSLGRLRFSKAVGALWTAASKDPEAAVRRDAALALSRLDAPGTAARLEEMLECERDPVARVGMIYGLNRLGQSWRLDQLLGLLEMDNPLVRENALNILDPSDLRGNDPEKLAIRLRALTETDGDPAVIAAAAAILNELASGV